MILEVAILNIRAGHTAAFESSFTEAAPIIAASPGYISHQLHRCMENGERYILLVRWQSLEDHTIGFRGSFEYQRWKVLLHHYYDPFPTVEHTSFCEPTVSVQREGFFDSQLARP